MNLGTRLSYLQQAGWAIIEHTHRIKHLALRWLAVDSLLPSFQTCEATPDRHRPQSSCLFPENSFAHMLCALFASRCLVYNDSGGAGGDYGKEHFGVTIVLVCEILVQALFMD